MDLNILFWISVSTGALSIALIILLILELILELWDIIFVRNTVLIWAVVAVAVLGVISLSTGFVYASMEERAFRLWSQEHHCTSIRLTDGYYMPMTTIAGQSTIVTMNYIAGDVKYTCDDNKSFIRSE